MRIPALIILLAGLFSFAYGQENKSDKKGVYLQSTIIKGDTMPHIELKEVPILPPKKFRNKAEERQYWRLVYNLKKVLPYSKIVAQTVREVDAKLASIHTDKERRKYIKSMEDVLWKQYEGDMRQMTITQGKLLFKLIDRETSQSTYFWIDSYRGSVSAFFWQGMARLFGTNLKSEYDPKGEDKLIEQIVTYIEKGLI
jgi:hypothetical protein